VGIAGKEYNLSVIMT